MENLNFELTLENESILLRPLRSWDYEQFLALTVDKDMWYYFTDDLSNPETLKNWIDAGIRQTNEQTRVAFAIVDKKNNKLIGSTSLGNISERDKRIEIGWTWISSEYRGKGVNDQSKFLLVEYCFEKLQFERVEFKTDVLNTYARRALLRIGATEEGILRSHTLMTNNRRRDTIYYSFLKRDWKNRQNKY